MCGQPEGGGGGALLLRSQPQAGHRGQGLQREALPTQVKEKNLEAAIDLMGTEIRRGGGGGHFSLEFISKLVPRRCWHLAT